ncbi:Ldh family oxidoreductase [Nocardia asiatica]|uniref:Ldh family oxidoreductase n=1 Tax=Nocardia asiatica TaxID=209252 RepID=UPI003EDF3936
MICSVAIVGSQRSGFSQGVGNPCAGGILPIRSGVFMWQKGSLLVLELRDVVHVSESGGNEQLILRGATLVVEPSEVAMLGGLSPAQRHALARLLSGRTPPRYGFVRSDPDVVVLDIGESHEPDLESYGPDGSGGRSVVLLTGAPAVARTGLRVFGLHGGEFVPATVPELSAITMVDADELRSRVEIELVRAGLPALPAQSVARVLVDADIRGHASHGVSLLPTYLRRIAAGGISPQAEPVVTHTAPAVISIDACGGPGQVAAESAARLCADRAAEQGVAAVAVHNNNHVGMLAAYRDPFQERQVVGLLLNISGPAVAAPGARRATLGSNALCLVTPGPIGGEPFCIDLATGVVAAGKIRDALNRGAPVAEGWLQDPAGRPTRDPAQLDAGGSIPLFGGYKGLCVTLLVEILAGALAGGLVSPQVSKQRKQPGAVMRCSQMFVGFAVGRFAAAGEWPTVPVLVQLLRQAVLDGYDSPPTEPWFPDQAEHRHTESAHSAGVPVPAAVLDELGWAGR